MNDFGKERRGSPEEGKKMTYIKKCHALIYQASLPLCKFNASVLPFRDKQEFSCKTATVTFSFLCLRARSWNKGLQLIPCEPKWNVSAIQSHAKKGFSWDMAPTVPGGQFRLYGNKAYGPRPASPPWVPPGLLHGPGSKDSPATPPSACVTTRLSFLLLNGAGTSATVLSEKVKRCNLRQAKGAPHFLKW